MRLLRGLQVVSQVRTAGCAAISSCGTLCWVPFLGFEGPRTRVKNKGLGKLNLVLLLDTDGRSFRSGTNKSAGARGSCDRFLYSRAHW